MIFRQSISGIDLSGKLNTAFRSNLDRAGMELAPIRDRIDNLPPYLALPGREDDLEEIERHAARVGSYARDVVILGTGGSSLGAQALHGLCPLRYDRIEDDTRLHYCANLDAGQMQALVDQIDWRAAHILAVSKSGKTAETLAQLTACLPAIENAVGTGELARHVTILTEPGENALRSLAGEWSIQVIDHDPDLGGRYSVLSAVGLLPAAIAGLDIRAVRKGAAAVLEQAIACDDPLQIPAAIFAALSATMASAGKHCSVLMPYDTRLERLSSWWQQLWAESLGKNGQGTTPIAALGPVDQHSQLQLFLDGPCDKIFTFVLQPTRGQGPVADGRINRSLGLDYLAGRSIGDLVEAEARATAATLARHGRPVRLLELARIDETTLGALFMQFMLETVMTAGIWGVNAFDQPAVEEGKILTRDTLQADFANLSDDGSTAFVTQI